MRKFYLLTMSANDDKGEVVNEAHNPQEVNPLDLKRCQRLPVDFFEKIKFRLEPGEPRDFVHLWMMVSPKALAIFEHFAGNDIQTLDVTCMDSEGKPCLLGYKIVNVLRSLEGTIDMEKSSISEAASLSKSSGRKVITIHHYVFRADNIPKDVHVFRPAEKLIGAPVISEELVKAFKEAKLTGYALIGTSSV